MSTFDRIARELLIEYGYEVLECSSDKEAIEKAEELKKGSRQYPVYFSDSDTSGEKLYEEFYTRVENTDMNRFSSLGVITGKEKPDKKRVETLLGQLEDIFERENFSKEELVSMLQYYLPDFEHIETGKSLDSKM